MQLPVKRFASGTWMIPLGVVLCAWSCGGGGSVGDGGRDGGAEDLVVLPAQCSNGVKDADELDVDCGGALCPACAEGAACLRGGDCRSGVCINNQCALATCDDGVRNGGESDVDCGGPCAARCALGQQCVGASDCTTGTCANGVCSPPLCLDGRRDGDESDVDCGGGLCPRCVQGQTCVRADDCQTRLCSNNLCKLGPTCANGTRDGDETGVDCGGSCPPCGGEPCDRPPPDSDGDGISDRDEGATESPPRDSDGDGTPDYLDLDSDDDGILDRYEAGNADRCSPPRDSDGDGTPDYLDLDSDGDCVSDAIEGGGTDSAAPRDTDGDGVPDYRDLDSDGDGLLDGSEDHDCDGRVGDCETDRVKADTDGDGVSDLVEYQACAAKTPNEQAALQCACDGADATRSPLTRGDFVFVSAYQQQPTPATETLDFLTGVNVDVVFALDSTGSMQSSLTNLANGLSGVVTKVRDALESLAIGVVDFKDFGDSYVVRYAERLHTVATGLASVQSQLSALRASGGGDGPEAGWEALYAIAARPGIDPRITLSGYDSQLPLGTVPTGEMGGTVGGAGFRSGSVPIVVTVTDAEWHDAPNSASGGENGLNRYASTYSGAPSRADAVARLTTIGARVIGLAALSSLQTGNPKARAVALAQDTGAVVGPAAFGPVGVRPDTCSLDQCCTGMGGAGESPVSIGGVGSCPLAYSVNGNDGSGVSDAVASGVIALAGGLSFDLHVEATDVDAGTVAQFIDRVVPNVSGTGPAAMCIIVNPATLADRYTGPRATPGADGVPDTVPDVASGKRVCFDVVPRKNTAVPRGSAPQLFRARLQVKSSSGGATVDLGLPRDAYFLVP